MNFIQQTSRYDFKGKRGTYQRTYEYRNEMGAIRWAGDVFGSCISAPTVFVPEIPDLGSFTMTAKGKLMNATYYLDDAAGIRFATVSRKGMGFRWKVLDLSGREIIRVVDAASWKEAAVRSLLGSLPDTFGVIQNDKLVARISKEELVEGARTKPMNRLGRFLDRIFSSHGMTMRSVDGSVASPDPRILVAVMTLLEVHDITGPASTG